MFIWEYRKKFPWNFLGNSPEVRSGIYDFFPKNSRRCVAIIFFFILPSSFLQIFFPSWSGNFSRDIFENFSNFFFEFFPRVSPRISPKYPLHIRAWASTKTYPKDIPRTFPTILQEFYWPIFPEVRLRTRPGAFTRTLQRVVRIFFQLMLRLPCIDFSFEILLKCLQDIT